MCKNGIFFQDFLKENISERKAAILEEYEDP